MAPRKVGMVDGDRGEWMHVRAMAMPCGLGARPRITGPPCGSSICHCARATAVWGRGGIWGGPGRQHVYRRSAAAVLT
jgi:hypothetical protein